MRTHTGLFGRAFCGLRKPLVFWLLAVDLILVGVTSVLGLQDLRQPDYRIPELLNISKDNSIGEYLNFLKWGLIIGALLMAYRMRGHVIFLALAIVFTLILADDSLQFHENFSEQVDHAFFGIGPMNSVRRAFFELGSFAVLAVVCAAVIFTSWRRTPEEVKTALKPLALLFIGLALCGVGLDLIHSLVKGGRMIDGILSIAEDGGELVFISLMTAYTVGPELIRA